jgi:short-subunit dehydrogenase
MITGRNVAGLERARAGVPPGQRDRLQLRVCDQSCAEDVEALSALLADPGTRIEGAILGVGSNPIYTEGPQRLHRLDPVTTDATIRTNCTHTLRLTGVILERFRKQRAGVLIWIGSQAYKSGLPGAALYCATKAFLSGLAHTAHNEYAHSGVRVHLLNPGLVRTPRTAEMIDRFAARHGRVVDEASEVAARIISCFLSPRQESVEVDL